MAMKGNVPFHCHICVSSLYENPDGFLGRYAYSDEEKIGSRDHPR